MDLNDRKSSMAWFKQKVDLFSSRSLSGNISTNASEVMTLPRVENEDEPSEDSPEENGTENSNGTGTTPHDNEETFENKKSDPFHFHIAPIVIYYDDENKTILEETQSREKTSSSSGNKSISGMKIKSGHNAIDEEIDLQNKFDPRKETCFQVFENCSSNQVNFTTGRDCLVQCGRAFIESIFTEDEEIDLQNNFDPRKETCFQVFENCSLNQVNITTGRDCLVQCGRAFIESDRLKYRTDTLNVPQSPIASGLELTLVISCIVRSSRASNSHS
ncbi:hypothetical protein Avbf_05029 [Armadillidium vulgare]|nr:hypothetical protein Avbf_05029 [Armadillidium vulgare]